MRANERQEGGSHYRSLYQHWDFVEDVGLTYHEAMIVRYLHRAKEVPLDYQKLVHFVEKEMEIRENRSPWRRFKLWFYRPRHSYRRNRMQEYILANKLNELQQWILFSLIDDHLYLALFYAKRLMNSSKED